MKQTFVLTNNHGDILGVFNVANPLSSSEATKATKHAQHYNQSLVLIDPVSVGDARQLMKAIDDINPSVDEDDDG
jgi:hypothetical protein